MAYRPKQRWSQLRKGGNARVAQTFGIDPLIASIILNRQVNTDEEIRRYLFGTLDDMEDPLKLDQIEEAAALLCRKIQDNKPIRVIGDYDADGICSTFILVSCLKKAGADVSYDIPDRVTDGFGMSIRLIEQAHSDGIDTIITCDNGIAQITETSRAKELGMTVIITDHHEPNYSEDDEGRRIYHLPDADVIVDPKKPGCTYPNKYLCGAGVAWKLMHVYESRYLIRETESPGILPAEKCPMTMKMLPFAAVATVTDIMKLQGENRILVKYGLKLLSDADNVGMMELLRANGLQDTELSAYHIGFVIGPCLNATGRLESAKMAITLLLETDHVRAQSEAARLVELNTHRKDMTEEGKAAAFEMIENTHLIHDRVLILYLKGIHESVAGIVASKVKETYHRPVMVFTDTEDPDHLKGSGRSIEEYNMHAEFSRVSDVFLKFGGHPMAAGATIERTKLEDLRRRLNENCTLSEEDLALRVQIDAAPPLSMLTLNLAEQMSVLEPCGTGNRSPLFGCSKVQLLKMSILGVNRNCVKLTVLEKGTRMDALYFGDSQSFIDYLTEQYSKDQVDRLMRGMECDIHLTLAYKLRINEYRGVRSLQLQIAHFQ